MGELQAWWNGYEVVAATSEAEARAIVKALPWYEGACLGDEDMSDGEGWKVLDDAKPVLDEDGKPTGQTFGEAAREVGTPCHLWSCEP